MAHKNKEPATNKLHTQHKKYFSILKPWNCQQRLWVSYSCCQPVKKFLQTPRSNKLFLQHSHRHGERKRERERERNPTPEVAHQYILWISFTFHLSNFWKHVRHQNYLSTVFPQSLSFGFLLTLELGFQAPLVTYTRPWFSSTQRASVWSVIPLTNFQNFIPRTHQGRKTLLQKQHIIISS
jgi:hypothetical protein